MIRVEETRINRSGLRRRELINAQKSTRCHMCGVRTGGQVVTALEITARLAAMDPGDEDED